MKSLDELAKIRDIRRADLKIREGVPSATEKAHIIVRRRGLYLIQVYRYCRSNEGMPG